jgi:glycogen debranching enzyme GlgX
MPGDLTQALATWLPGRPGPLGACPDGGGVSFTVASDHAHTLHVCLFDPAGRRELAQLPLFGPVDGLWHGHLSGGAPGLVYGLRADGPWDPARGQRFNPHKLLLDPYAREVVGRFDWRDAHAGALADDPLRRDERDNAAVALKARVVSDDFDWGDDAPPHIAPQDTVLYELHVRGFSRRQAALPLHLRGSYAGLAHPASIDHLQALGVTSVQLMPVHFALDERRLSQQGLRNYWAYNTLAFFCPDPRLASGHNGLSVRDEFRTMVRALHQAGIEVILDVVFNHSAETDEHGPTIGLRGLDNASYYRLRDDAPALYDNFSGCGNTLDIRRPQVLRLVMDCLRYWVQEMHVDGFRFDLASVLGRTKHGFEPDAPFFMALAQDPVLAGVKTIAEPWDLGPDGYQLGRFPRGWMEWNDQFRDTLRRFWLGGDTSPSGGEHTRAGLRGLLARRLCGSDDLFRAQHRLPAASVNYVVAHDGFTLRDLVSYNQRHNLANGENNQDGHADNLSWNCGVEGPSDDAGVQSLRDRLQRALLACTVLAQGTPMLAAGAEIGHDQGGNNNAYNQDNPTSWIDWSDPDAELLAFTTHLLAVRRTLLPLGPDWYADSNTSAQESNLGWLRPDGAAMQDADWANDDRTLACLIRRPGRSPVPLLLLINASGHAVDFQLPAGSWQAVLDTAQARGDSHWAGLGALALRVQAHSLQLLATAMPGAVPGATIWPK